MKHLIDMKGDLSPSKQVKSLTTDSPLEDHLVAPSGEGWRWASTWTIKDEDGERYGIEFVRRIKAQGTETKA